MNAKTEKRASVPVLTGKSYETKEVRDLQSAVNGEATSLLAVKAARRALKARFDSDVKELSGDEKFVELPVVHDVQRYLTNCKSREAFFAEKLVQYRNDNLTVGEEVWESDPEYIELTSRHALAKREKETVRKTFSGTRHAGVTYSLQTGKGKPYSWAEETVKNKERKKTDTSPAADADTGTSVAADADTGTSVAADADTDTSVAADADTDTSVAADADTGTSVAADADTGTSVADICPPEKQTELDRQIAAAAALGQDNPAVFCLSVLDTLDHALLVKALSEILVHFPQQTVESALIRVAQKRAA